MREYTTNEVLSFLTNFKERKEIEKKFELNNMQSWKLVKWLMKAGLIEELKCKVDNRTSKNTYFYKTRK